MFRLTTDNLIKIAVGVKVLLLIGLWLALDSGIQLGDKQLNAAEPPPEPIPQGSTQPASKPAESAPQVTQADTSQKTESKSRLSFLSGLLNLPPLDDENLKKEEVDRYLELAERKEQQVETRLAVLTERESQLVNVEGRVTEKLRLLEEERRMFEQSRQKEQKLKDERLEKLIPLYAKMEPKKAAPVFEQMDKDLVVALFSAIKQKQITAILENMTPEKSVEITEYYGRVRSGREYEMLKEVNRSLVDAFKEDCTGMPAAAAE